MLFWVFHVLRDYAATLREGHSAHLPLLPTLMAEASGWSKRSGQSI